MQQYNTNAKEQVVTLHGLGRDQRMMYRIAQKLSSEGYGIVNASYPSTKYPIEQLTDIYLRQILSLPNLQQAEKIHFVTHSLGSILVRHYLKNESIPNLGRIVMIAPPNNGTELVQWLKNHWLLKHFFKSMGPAGKQLGTDEISVPLQLGPLDADFGIIAGNRSYNPIFSAVITGKDDGKVSVESAKLANMSDFLEVPCCHTYIVNNPNVIAQTSYFLKNGQFQKATSKTN